MDQDEFLQYAQREIEELHNNPFLVGCFDKIDACLMLLKIFQFITIGVIVLLAVRFNTFDNKAYWKTNRIILIFSGLVLSIMIIYECLNHKYMSSGFDSVPIGIQLIALLAAVCFYVQKKS